MEGAAVMQVDGKVVEQPAPEWCDLTVKVVVYGAKGAGKTTLVASLLARHGCHAPAPAAAVQHGPLPANADKLVEGSAKESKKAAEHQAAEAPDTGLEAALAGMAGTNEHTAVMRVGKQWVCMEVVDVPGDVCTMANFHRVLPGQTDSGASLALVGDVFVVCYDPSVADTLMAAEGILKMVAAQKDPLPVRAVLCATKCDGRVTLPGSTQATTISRGKRIARDLGITHALTSAEDKGRGVDECFSLAVRQALLSLELEHHWCFCC